MNLGNLSKENLTLYSDGKNASMKITTPISLIENLRTKRIGIKQLTIDSSSFPQFIPEVQTKPEQQNYNPRGTITANVIGTYAGADWDSIILGRYLAYFVVLRTKNNEHSCASFLQYQNPNDFPQLNQPSNFGSLTSLEIGKYIDEQRYKNPYYWMFNFTDFLNYISKAIDDAFNNLEPANPQPSTICLYDQANKTFHLSIAKYIYDNYYLEFSPELFKLLKFNATTINDVGTYTIPPNPTINYFAKTYRIQFNPIETFLNSDVYFSTVARAQNNIFPFDTFILESVSLPVKKTYFRSSKDESRTFTANFNVVKLWKKKINILEMNQNIYSENEDITDDSTNMTFDNNFNNFIDFKLIAKGTNGEFVEWVFPEGESIEMIMYIYDIY